MFLSLFSAQVCQAAFPASTTNTASATAAAKVVHHSKWQELKSLLPHGADRLDPIVYIILAIFPLGWLAMGLNDNFKGNDWLISLVLYILGWLPGIVYTLYMMSKYY